jgi:hypothetical protein
MSAPLTNRERVLATFRKQPIDRIVWQPRIHHWYNTNYQRIMGQEVTYPALNTYPPIPADLRGKGLMDVFRTLGCSPRYAPENLGKAMFSVHIDTGKVKTDTEVVDGHWVTTMKTPAGELRSVSRAGYHSEYLLKSPADFAPYCYVLEHQSFVFNPENYENAVREFGDEGVPNEYFPRAPLQRLIIELMGFDNAILNLFEYPDETQALMNDIAAWDDGMYQVLGDSPVEILNFGENLDGNLDSPELFEEHLAPYYEKRVAQLKAKGKLTHIHADGSLKPLIPLLRNIGFDGIEAATPLPQGDVTVAEIRELVGDAILLDGIPAIHFLTHHTTDELLAMTQDVLDTFSPGLILGVSDELPPGADIERVRLVGELVKSYSPPAARRA